MGVPAFFRWLSRKYPSVIVPCVEQKPVDVNGVAIPINSSDPNPNGVEFDNLYLDMNGIIHPCTHPEDKPAPKNEDEMMVAIFECIDRLFMIVRPRKLLYMAIDGVAPRAKMNQQRSRRFRASKEAYEKMQEVKRIRADLLLKGIKLPDEKPKEEHFDSNCITPGTPFMARLSQCLHYYIHERLNNDPGWENVKVILSDANVPGEGEHKIMDFIRKQRAQPNHDPNTQHCLCGADADLIMLGLATHEPNFTIIREEFKPNKPRPCEICGQIGHEMKECTGGCQSEQETPADVMFGSETEFIFVRLNVLKEYLERELQMPNLPFRYDFERVIDDWVFMCFFVGNDFLPHLPSLEIRENAIDRLITLYKDCVYKTGGYLTDSGDVNLERVEMILYELGKVEDEIFKSRQQRELMFKARAKAKKQRSDEYSSSRPNWSLVNNTQFAPKRIGEAETVQNARNVAYDIRRAGMNATSTKTALESMLVTAGPSKESSSGTKRPHDSHEGGKDDSDDDQAHDEVRLWEVGFKERYYESKFDVTAEELEFRHCVALQYVRGLCWVLKYYYQGCPSWKWYFPYHYAPFASDFFNISGLSTEFETDTEPFHPLEQLMSVFPAASSKHVPEPWAELMTSPDSPIIDFYPEDFKIDLNGKKFAWQGVALLPFVDENRLFSALKSYYAMLTEAERKRNMRGDDRLYMSLKHKSSDIVISVYKQSLSVDIESEILTEGMQGTMLAATECVKVGGSLGSPVQGLTELRDNAVCCVRFRDPKYAVSFKFMAVKLRGARDPPRVLKPEDFNNRNWRPQIGMAPATQRAFLDTGGHRTVNFHSGAYQQQQRGPNPRQYGNVPPQYSSNYSRGYNPSYPRTFNDRGHSDQQQQNRDYSTRTQNQNTTPRGGYGNYRPRHQYQGPYQGSYHGNQRGSYNGSNPRPSLLGPYRGGWNGQGNRSGRR